jgi:hypothetical protein
VSLLAAVAEVPMPPPVICGASNADTPWLGGNYCEAPPGGGYFPPRWSK